jgi:hypothetical protein
LETTQSIFNQNGDEQITPPTSFPTVEISNPAFSTLTSGIITKADSPTTNNTPKHNLKTASRTGFNKTAQSFGETLNNYSRQIALENSVSGVERGR